jgi:hypothetical protein
LETLFEGDEDGRPDSEADLCGGSAPPPLARVLLKRLVSQRRSRCAATSRESQTISRHAGVIMNKKLRGAFILVVGTFAR